MKPPHSHPHDTEGTERPRGFWGGVLRDWRQEKSKGLIVRGVFRQQKKMAVNDRQMQFLNEAKQSLSKAIKLKIAPTRVETFEAAVARQGLTEEFLHSQLQRHKWAHLCLYLAAAAMFVYAFKVALQGSVILFIGVFAAAFATAVNGYIHGFRAWQIEKRNLIRLQDALRIPGTYLVL